MRRLLPSAVDLPDDAAVEEQYLVPAARHVRANFVTSLDGVVEIEGRSQGLGGAADRTAFMAMRAVTDVVLVGAGTVRSENYGPVRLAPDVIERRRGRGQSSLPVMAIVSNRGDLDAGARVFAGDGERPWLLTSKAGASAHEDLGAVARVVVCGDRSVDLEVALAELTRSGRGRVLCEGGPALFGTLLAACLLDEVCLTLSPWLIGPSHRRLLGDHDLPKSVHLQLLSLIEGDGMLLARYGCLNSSDTGNRTNR
jgi:riboflavin biosynthesis pyrimidine reductase